MGRKSRDKAKRRRRVVGPVDYPALAEAIHRTVCTVTGDDGSRWCLDYASIACTWLNAHANGTYNIVGGQLVVQMRNYRTANMSFEHFWVVEGGRVYDFATRHNPAILLRNKLAGGRDAPAELRITPENFDGERLGVNFYVGTGEDVADVWGYVQQAEPTQFARTEFRKLRPNLEEAVRRVNLLLARKS